MRIEGFNSRCKNYIKRLNNFIKEARNARLDRVDGVLRKTNAFIFYFKIVANEIGIKQLRKEELEVYNEIESGLNQIRMILEAIAKSNDEIFLELIAPNLTQLEKLASVTAILFEQFQKDYIEGLAGQLQRAMKLLRTIQESGIEIVPYSDKKEISLRVHHFLDEIDRGIFLHLYVPNGRYQEDQLANFLRLFESYLQRVEQLQFSIETRRTMHGTVYEFKSQSMKMNLVDMEVALSRFEDFMSLCQYDQEKAEASLLKKGIKASDARRLLTKYFKEYRRLLLDIEHEREIKVIELRHKYESEALDLADGSDLEVPQVMQPTSLLSLSPHAEPINVTITNSSVNINPALQTYIEQVIYGDIHYTTEDKELLQLFAQYAQGLEAVRLRSDLEQLKDASLPDVERKTAKQKIGGFLAKVAPSIGQAVLSVLTAYLEKVLTGS